MQRAGKAAIWTLGAVVLGLSLFHFVVSAHRSRAHGIVDFPIFLEQAQEFLQTGQLYPLTDADQRYAPGTAVYKFPPLYAMLLLPLVHGGIDPAVGWQHWLLQIVLYAVALLLALQLAEGARPRIVALVLLVAGLNFEPFFETLWRLQLETPILLLLLAALLLARNGRDVAAGAALGVAVMLKLYPGFFLIPLLLGRRWRMLASSAVTLVAVGLAGVVVIGVQQNLVFLREILPRMLAESALASNENLSLAAYAQAWRGVSPGLAKLLAQGAAVPMLALTVLAVLRGARTPQRAPLEFAAFVPLALLIMPNSWVNYQLLLLLPFAVLLPRALDGTPRWLPYALGLAYLFCLFYAPCELTADSRAWPCSATPPWLGLQPLPRALHDRFVDGRILSSLLLWLVALHALRRGGRPVVAAGAAH